MLVGVMYAVWLGARRLVQPESVDSLRIDPVTRLEKVVRIGPLRFMITCRLVGTNPG